MERDTNKLPETKLLINPEILSNKPTHKDTRRNLLVKVFQRHMPEGLPSYTAEIMEGKDKGKWTTVFTKDLVEL